MSNTTQQPSRMLWADILKFWGILAIAWGHTLNDGAVMKYLYSFHVAIFFFAVGLYFKSPRISFGSFCKKRAISLLVPYFIFAVISTLIYAVLGKVASVSLDAGVTDFSLRTNLYDILTGRCRANRPLWFLPSMFIFSILCFGFTKLTDKCSNRLRTLMYILAATLSIVLCIISGLDSRGHVMFWKANTAVFLFGFFVFAIMGKPLLMGTSVKFHSILLMVLLLVLGCILALQNIAVSYPSNTYGNVLLFYISATCTIFGLCLLSIFISHANIPIIHKTLAYVGQHTLPILLMHKFPILFFQVLFPWTRQPMKNNNVFVGLVVALLSIAGCLAVAQIWKKALGTILSKFKSR